MNHDLLYSFEELSLGGFTDHKGVYRAYSILANGVAHIEFDYEGEWEVRSIEIDTHAELPEGGYERGRAFLFFGDNDLLYRTIEAALHSKPYSDRIDDKVTDALSEERNCAHETREEYRRSI